MTTKPRARRPKPSKPGGGHDMDLAAKLLSEHAAGTPAYALVRKYRVSNTYVHNVLHNNSATCAGCGLPFFPTKDGTRWGSRDCYYTSLHQLGRKEPDHNGQPEEKA